VEAQQCVKLTRTNRPFGLTIKLSQSVAEVEQATEQWFKQSRNCGKPAYSVV
jgi:hypothetical protein